VVRTGKPGRPRKVPNASWLAKAVDPRSSIDVKTTAATIGLHRHTLRSYLEKFEIDYQYSDISDADLDVLIRDIKDRHPEFGIRYILGALRGKGHKVQKRRMMESLRRIDSVGLVLRRQGKIQRRRYKVSRPQALWHFDGHHKLIRWGIVIHGIIDGYCRTVRSLLHFSLQYLTNR
jgi:hypothetical protein